MQQRLVVFALRYRIQTRSMVIALEHQPPSTFLYPCVAFTSSGGSASNVVFDLLV